jgi:hypothetical protein
MCTPRMAACTIAGGICSTGGGGVNIITVERRYRRLDEKLRVNEKKMAFEVEGQDSALGCEMIMRPAGAWHIHGENAIIGVPRRSAVSNRAQVGLILGIYRWHSYPSVIRNPRGHPRVVLHKSGGVLF